MNFNFLDTHMRQFETNHDVVVLPGIWMVARLDGRTFTKLTKDILNFERPFDIQFRDFMVETVEHLMQIGFRIVFGYTQSDEISLLFHHQASDFGRKTRKLNSVLAGEASAKFSLMVGQIAVFDCRISQLPQQVDVEDYFRWRQADAARNALNAHCYWLLRRQGKTARQADSALQKLSRADKNELLFQNGINFNDVPSWQKRGTGLYWETYEKIGKNPLTNEETLTQRRRIYRDFELPMSEAYQTFIQLRIAEGLAT